MAYVVCATPVLAQIGVPRLGYLPHQVRVHNPLALTAIEEGSSCPLKSPTAAREAPRCTKGARALSRLRRAIEMSSMKNSALAGHFILLARCPCSEVCRRACMRRAAACARAPQTILLSGPMSFQAWMSSCKRRGLPRSGLASNKPASVGHAHDRNFAHYVLLCRAATGAVSHKVHDQLRESKRGAPCAQDIVQARGVSQAVGGPRIGLVEAPSCHWRSPENARLGLP